MPETSDLLTVRETAAFLRVSIRTVYHLVTEGDIPAVKLGGTWRISRTALDKQLLNEAIDKVDVPIAAVLPPMPNIVPLTRTCDMLAREISLLREELREAAWRLADLKREES